MQKSKYYPKLGSPGNGLTLEDAKEIRDIKRGATYRRLAEHWFPKKHQLHGNQLAGEDLCREACALLGIDWMNPPEFPHTPEFDKENQSYYGPFYWWE